MLKKILIFLVILSGTSLLITTGVMFIFSEWLNSMQGLDGIGWVVFWWISAAAFVLSGSFFIAWATVNASRLKRRSEQSSEPTLESLPFISTTDAVMIKIILVISVVISVYVLSI